MLTLLRIRPIHVWRFVCLAWAASRGRIAIGELVRVGENDTHIIHQIIVQIASPKDKRFVFRGLGRGR